MKLVEAVAQVTQLSGDAPVDLTPGYSLNTPMFGNVTALGGLQGAGKYRHRSVQHTCSWHAAWNPHISPQY